jgi:L-lactate dehydrogenase complex protein LldF
MSYKEFIKSTKKHSFDNSNFIEVQPLFTKGKEQYVDIEKAKDYVSAIKSHTIENLDIYLKEFEANFNKNGGKILWADTTQDATKEIIKILKIFEIKSIVKSKSELIDEIELIPHFRKENIEVFESFVSENTKFEIDELLKIKQQIVNSEAGISEVDFLISDIGGISISENEGNIFLSSSASKIHIFVSTIEKIIPSITDYEYFTNLFSAFSTGQKITAYNTIITSQQKIGEIDGSERIYLVLLNNGRTKLLNTEQQYKALNCIKCDSCSMVCPIQKIIGNKIDFNPVEAVKLPHLKTIKQYGYLSYLCTNCGACDKICPMKIPINNLLIKNRIDFSNKKILPKLDYLTNDFKNFSLQKRNRLDVINGFFKNILLNILYKNYWGKHKKTPKFYKNSFSNLYKNNNKFY